jgi:hypothetical protein
VTSPATTTGSESGGGLPWWGWALIGLGAVAVLAGVFSLGRHGRKEPGPPGDQRYAAQSADPRYAPPPVDPGYAPPPADPRYAPPPGTDPSQGPGSSTDPGPR